MGNVVALQARVDRRPVRAHYTMRLLEEAGLPPGVINLVYGRGSAIGASPGAVYHPRTSPASTSPARLGVFQEHVEDDRRRTSTGYRNYPRIVGETGGKDFIVAHPSADVEALATAIVRGVVRVPGPEVLRRLARRTCPRTSGPSCASGSSSEVGTIKMGDVSDFSQLHGRRDRRRSRSRDRRRRSSDARANEAEVIAGGGTDDTDGLLRRADRDPDRRTRATG